MGVQIAEEEPCSPQPCVEDSPADQHTKSTTVVHSSSSSSAGQCLEFESETSPSSSDFDLHIRLYETIEGLQRVECCKPKKRKWRNKRKSCRSGRNRNSAEKREENVCGGRQVCNCAASFAADCAVICCCPCALVHLLFLALVKLPSVFARKAFCYAKNMARTNTNHQNDDDDDDEKREKPRYYTPPWSCTESPQTSGPLDGSFTPNFDSHKLWSELYAAGHMGFGGLPFERN